MYETKRKTNHSRTNKQVDFSVCNRCHLLGGSGAQVSKICNHGTMKHQDFYRAVVNSPAWQNWGKVAHEHGFDWHESVECNWLSDKHFAAFLGWYKNGDNNKEV